MVSTALVQRFHPLCNPVFLEYVSINRIYMFRGGIRDSEEEKTDCVVFIFTITQGDKKDAIDYHQCITYISITSMHAICSCKQPGRGLGVPKRISHCINGLN